jgi:hypothetical protein
MNKTEQSKLLATRAAVGREPLAKLLIELGLSYNQSLTALKSAPRRKSVNLSEAGRDMALRLLGKV